MFKNQNDGATLTTVSYLCTLEEIPTTLSHFGTFSLLRLSTCTRHCMNRSPWSDRLANSHLHDHSQGHREDCTIELQKLKWKEKADKKVSPGKWWKLLFIVELEITSQLHCLKIIWWFLQMASCMVLIARHFRHNGVQRTVKSSTVHRNCPRAITKGRLIRPQSFADSHNLKKLHARKLIMMGEILQGLDMLLKSPYVLPVQTAQMWALWIT